MSVYFWLLVYVLIGVLTADLSDVYPKNRKQYAEMVGTLIITLLWPIVWLFVFFVVVNDLRKGQ